jgi:hypothetical protein
MAAEVLLIFCLVLGNATFLELQPHNLGLPAWDTICYTVPYESKEPDGVERSHGSEMEGR